MIWFCSHFQFQERVLFASFWSSKCSNRPCSGFLALQGSLKCHGIAVKTTTMAVVQLPKSLENRSTTTPLVGIPGRLCLRWTSRNVFFVTQRKKRKGAEAKRHLPQLYLGVFPNDSAQHCSNMSPWTRLFTPIVPRRSLHTLASISYLAILVKYTLAKKKKIKNAWILMRKDDVCSWRSTSWQTFFVHASSYVQKVHQPQVPGLRCHCQQGECQKSFWSFNDWAQWQLPDMAFKCLTRTSMIEEWITDAYCIMSLLNHIVPYVWQVTARWSTVKSCQRVQFEELESHHRIKRHFDMRLVFHRPNKCTESQYVFSSEVQPGPIIEGCLRLDKAQDREEEKELAMKWCAWWGESQWCIRRDTACV